MDLSSLEKAAERLLSGALIGRSWVEPLEAMMLAMGAQGGGIARTTPPQMFAIPTSGVRQQFADFKAGRCPPLTKRSHIACRSSRGFVSDDMVFDAEHRRRDAFYQEFLLPRRCAHQASAFLDATPAGDVNLIAFRSPAEGPFDAGELTAFALVLPYVRAAAMASGQWLKTEARREADPFVRRGEPVIHLASDGSVLEVNGDVERRLAPVLRVVGRRLTAAGATDQRRLDGALKAALIERRPSLTSLFDAEGEHVTRVLAIPVLGDAVDLFRTTAALVVAIDDRRPAALDLRTLGLLARDAALTPRETDVVHLIASGRSPRDLAETMGIALETARLHLKAAYRKLDVHGQTELALLVKRLSTH